MAMTDDNRRDAALEWVRCIADPLFDDWEAHLAWLEADPAHAAAFDEASLLIEDATEGLQPASLSLAEAVNDNGPGGARHRTWAWLSVAGAAIAAGVVAMIGLQPSRVQEPDRIIATGAGQTREIRLTDGTRVSLNGDTAISIDRADARHVTLRHGEAFFSVAPSKGRHFTVTAGDAVFQDLATAFDVIHEEKDVDLAVQEGAVLYDPSRTALRVAAGQHMRLGATTATITTIDPASVGSWRAGRLIYRDASLAVIAGDLQRTLGVKVSIDPALQDRHFSGVIVVGADQAEMFRRIASVMHVKARKAGTGWHLEQAVQ